MLKMSAGENRFFVLGAEPGRIRTDLLRSDRLAGGLDQIVVLFDQFASAGTGGS